VIRKAASAVALVIVGFVIGVAAVAVHARWWGLTLAAGAALAGVLALRPGLQRVAYAAGWIVATALAVVPRPEGDYAVASDVSGYLFLALGVVLVILALATLPVRPRSARR